MKDMCIKQDYVISGKQTEGKQMEVSKIWKITTTMLIALLFLEQTLSIASNNKYKEYAPFLFSELLQLCFMSYFLYTENKKMLIHDHCRFLKNSFFQTVLISLSNRIINHG